MNTGLSSDRKLCLKRCHLCSCHHDSVSCGYIFLPCKIDDFGHCKAKSNFLSGTKCISWKINAFTSHRKDCVRSIQNAILFTVYKNDFQFKI